MIFAFFIFTCEFFNQYQLLPYLPYSFMHIVTIALIVQLLISTLLSQQKCPDTNVLKTIFSNACFQIKLTMVGETVRKKI